MPRSKKQTLNSNGRTPRRPWTKADHRELKFANRLWRYGDIWVHLDSHLIWQVS